MLLELKKGIGVSIHYATPVPLMYYYKNKYGYKKDDFLNENLFNDIMPVYSNL